ncbi:MAG TPA: hypothetical protein VK914_05595 [bacterium]|jgi:hypothetical protein|nr:hypothetical protein [bacterium]
MPLIRWMALFFCSLALASSGTLAAEQGLSATPAAAAVQALTGSAARSDLVMEPVLVHAKRDRARPLPDWLKKELNSPLNPAPTPTAFEKKIAPTVRTAQNFWYIGIFAAILVGGIAKEK